LPAQFSDQASRIATDVQADWLARSFRAVDADFGGFDSYIRHTVGLSPDTVAELRDRMLTSA
jgi:protein tyrosine/serine phosphatase